jgi:hypothetical protein
VAEEGPFFPLTASILDSGSSVTTGANLG